VEKVKAKKLDLIHIVFMKNGTCPYFTGDEEETTRDKPWKQKGDIS